MIQRTLEQRHYQIQFPVGEGRQGMVYCVKKIGDEKFCACKVIRERKMWEREVCFLQMVQGSGFPEYYESWWQGDFGMLIMEYAEGQSLEAFIKHRKYITERRMYTVALEIAGALAYLHQKNPPILYRDLKPSNIRILSNGAVKLVDLGAACQMKENGGESMNKREDFSIAGTPGYAAPEQFVSHAQIGTYSDVYAFGKLLYYLLEASDRRFCNRKKGVKGCFQAKRIRQRVKRVATGCVQTESASRFPDMKIVFCKLQNGKGIIYNVQYEKNICVYNSG